MEDAPSKPGGRCRFAYHCFLYNANILNPLYEKEMCGTGSPKPDENYVPQIPQHDNITPVKGWEIWPQGECPAFLGYVLEDFRDDLEDMVKDTKRVIQGKPPLLK